MTETAETARGGEPTRRDAIEYGGTVVDGGVLAGCTDGTESESTANATGSASDPTTAADAAYSVPGECVGPIEFGEEEPFDRQRIGTIVTGAVDE